jgi:hypothetical protein
MKKITFKGVVAFFALVGTLTVNAQQKTKSETKNSGSAIELTEATKESLAKTGYARCLTDEHEAYLQQKHPRRHTRAQFEQFLAPHIAKIKADRLAGKFQAITYNIPVVIHIIHNGDAENTPGNVVGENISDAQAISQIQVLNEDYQRLVGSPGGANSTGLAEDLEISFCLAKQDEFGVATPGIIRYNITPYTNTATPGVVDDWELKSDVETMKATNQWDPTKYMNMWSIKPGGADLPAGLTGLLGYAQFPERSTTGLGDLAVSETAVTDGVVAGYDAFGDIGEDDGSFIMNGTYNLGRTMTHEVGHWLGLYHTFQGSCSVNNDYCADTPAVSTPNYSCVVTNSCTGGAYPGNDMIENYMDYTPDACMDTFTQNQKDRVHAVMANSPRRVELNTSIGCQDTAPFIAFTTEILSVNESTDCNFTDITVNVEIGKAPTQPADVTITKAGSVTEMIDYEVIGGNLTFPTSGFANQSFTLRIHNDGFVESVETLTLGMTLNANAGDAILTTAADKEMVITINDNDLARNTNVTLTHFYDDFEDQDISDWTLSDDDGDTLTWGMYSIGTPQSNPVAITSQSWSSTATPNELTPDNWAVSPSIDLTSVVAPITLEWKVQASAASWDLEEYSVYVSTSSATGTLVTSPTTFNEIYNDPADAGSSYTRTLDLSAHAGQTVYVGLRHWNCTNQEWLSIDDINVTSTIPTDVQLAVNTTNQIPLSSAGSIYSSDSVTGDVMVDIANNNGVDYNCVSTNVSRASGGAQMYQVAGAANFVMDKTYTITPSSVQVGGNATLKFYFTEAEVSAWEGATGNSRNTLAVIKDNGASEIVAATLGAFGSHVTLEATFTSGINGTYYFGKMGAVLGVAENQFNSFSIFPNPSNGIFNLSVSTTDDAKVKLFDIRGRNVYSELHTNNSDVFNTTLDFSSLASGVYMLDIESGSKRAVKKIVIQ